MRTNPLGFKNLTATYYPIGSREAKSVTGEYIGIVRKGNSHKATITSDSVDTVLANPKKPIIITEEASSKDKKEADINIDGKVKVKVNKRKVNQYIKWMQIRMLGGADVTVENPYLTRFESTGKKDYHLTITGDSMADCTFTYPFKKGCLSIFPEKPEKE